MKLLVVGSTGTLGRQIVRRALDEGHEVRCIVRSFQRASFLREWGVELVRGDIVKPATLPPALDGVDAVIDAATARPTESVQDVDWQGKVNLIQAMQASATKRFIFFSILNAEKYPHVPLMNVKHSTENFLAESGLDYTILSPCGFLQGLIGQYAIPILERQAVWVMGEAAPIAYMDTQDIAQFAIQALSIPEIIGRRFPLAGTRAWGAYEIIRLCERKSGQTARVSRLSLRLLRGIRRVAQFFQWGWNFADRLAFVEVIAGSEPIDAPMDDVYAAFGIDRNDVSTLEEYLQEYFTRIMKKLKELDYDSKKAKKKKLPF